MGGISTGVKRPLKIHKTAGMGSSSLRNPVRVSHSAADAIRTGPAISDKGGFLVLQAASSAREKEQT